MELRNFFKKKKLKNTAQNSCEFNQKNTRKKFLKIFAAASLALITCATTLLATAPFGTGAASAATNTNLSNNTQTTSQGLITPQEDDPVLFKTESGLEIKWGNALTGNLTDFPYFISTNSSGIEYTWVIIGRASDMTSARVQINGTIVIGEKSPFEFISSAGQAIGNDNKFLKLFNGEFSSSILSNIPDTSEITPGCLLVMLNGYTDSCVWDPGGSAGESYSLNESACVVRQKLETYYTNNTFGINDHVVNPTLSIRTAYHNSSMGTGNLGTSTCSSLYYWPLGTDTSYENFVWSSYLTASEVALPVNQWTRSPDTFSRWRYINTSGEHASQSPKSGAYIRPAALVKLY